MRKNLHRPPCQKKASKADTAPQTADEFLAAGVDFEEAGEKWRAGDAVKATRFFRRAIENYDVALSKFPDAFDIAYNKARVQYQLTQHPKLAAQMPASQVDLLRVALESHREALRLREEHADVLFNTAQVLTSLAEALLEASGPGNRGEALPLLEEAVNLFQKCLLVQEREYITSEEPPADTPAEEDAAMEETQSDGAASAAESEQWALLVEPVTKDTLLDSILAQLETLRTMCGMVSSDPSAGDALAWIEKYHAENLDGRLSIYAPTDAARLHDVSLVRANFAAALAEAQFRAGRHDAPSYQQTLERVFGDALDVDGDPAGLCDKAEGLMSFSAALNEAASGLSPAEQRDLDDTRWKALTTAQASLTAASKLPSASNVARIHLARGDVEMLRLQIGQPPGAFELAQRGRATLLQNAKAFYRGAVGFARAVASGAEEEELEGTVKEAVAASVGGDCGAWESLTMGQDVLRRVIGDAQAEGVIPLEWAAPSRP